MPRRSSMGDSNPAPIHMSPERRDEVLAANAIAHGPSFKPVPMHDFAGTTLPEPEWAVEGIWAKGDSGVIGGRPKDKKSSLAVELAISLASGTSMFNVPSF